jgi:hypothetical protein
MIIPWRRPHIIPELHLRVQLLRRSLRRRRPDADPLWSHAAEFDQSWTERIRAMAQYIDRPGAVADFGCGPMWLEHYLPPQNSYLPIDYIRRDVRTIVVDLRRDPLPPLHATVAFMSGVLEYIPDLQALVAQVERQDFTRVIASYNTVERVPRKAARESINWVNHLRLDELLALFLPSFDLIHMQIIGTNTVVVFDRKPAGQR